MELWLYTTGLLQLSEEAALVGVVLHTGRTHQIRVHMSALGHPVVGDTLYGSRSKHIDRQALHASSIEFEWEGKDYMFEIGLPEDMRKLMKHLEG